MIAGADNSMEWLWNWILDKAGCTHQANTKRSWNKYQHFAFLQSGLLQPKLFCLSSF